VHYPLLELDELDMKAGKFPLVFLPFQLAAGFVSVILGVGHRFVLQSTSSTSHP
jgi:hypothetical protein